MHVKGEPIRLLHGKIVQMDDGIFFVVQCPYLIALIKVEKGQSCV